MNWGFPSEHFTGKSMNTILNRFIVAVVLIMLLGGCSYSFTGASISPEVKTVSIKYFPNYAPYTQPTLSQTFTEKLKDRFLNQTSLSLLSSGGDLNFEGAIVDYKNLPTAIQTGDKPGLNRLTIKVKVNFTNNKDPKQNFETTFERFAEYDSNKQLIEVEGTLITQITDQLIDDIFNKSVVNW